MSVCASIVAVETDQPVTQSTVLTIRGEQSQNSTTLGSLNASSTVSFNLPELPSWTVHLLAGTLSFLLVLAVILLLVQFPPAFSFFSPQRWGRTGYVTIEEGDDHCQDGHGSGLLLQREADIHSPHLSHDKLRKRRPNQLSIDTSAGYHGLGIAVPGRRQGGRTLQEREPYECGPSHLQPPFTATRGAGHSLAFTAPLPSAKAFEVGMAGWNMATDMENSHSTTPSPSSSGLLSAETRPDRASGAQTSATASSLFEKISNGITRAADKLSTTFYDHVAEPEEGLLLPVYSDEREESLVHRKLAD